MFNGAVSWVMCKMFLIFNNMVMNIFEIESK